MPPRLDPRDWDRLFSPHVHRRGGLLRALANLLMAGVVIALLFGGAFLGLRLRDAQIEARIATVTAVVATNEALSLLRSTQEARDATATVEALTVPSPGPIPPESLGRGTVIAGGNLRSEPLVLPETVLGQICIGDEVVFLQEQNLADGVRWYQIRVLSTAADCTPERVPVETVGWASSLLLSPPAP
ncbi:SH3 domain-containing protein [Candidatus Chloroploca sp. M-50]|uniref:SH3 domain-containing protein n=1 Tax=Candidatus Chloroploca mongolica TaxID=2528176 RepID=A0ABS4DCB7_9CHLR|nr:SH3 domain-containing protein [Candidatus Chloroploca mongolica]MBP1467092.1 SH3 domain-containing protein [Candidatus Chloroploca mongolica]